MEILIFYLAFLNILAFGAFGADKRRARLGKRRVPEARLMLYAALGGAVGAILGMAVFRHKTRKPKFVFGVPALLALWAAGIYLAVRFGLI